MSVTAERLGEVEHGDTVRVYVGESTHKGAVHEVNEYDHRLVVELIDVRWDEWVDRARLVAEREDGELGSVVMEVMREDSADENAESWREWWTVDKTFDVDGLEVLSDE